MNILFKGIFGSKLYGTDNEFSDTDYKAIYIPDIKNCILGNYSHNITIKTNGEKNVKNSAEDVDCETYAIQEFIKLALQGQTVAIDMMATPKDKTLISSPEWEILVANRKRFYTKNMKSFTGYSLAMANKYGARAEKLNAFRDIQNFLLKEDKNAKLKDIWDKLPENEFYKKVTDDNNRNFYEINGRRMQEFATVDFVIDLVEIQISDYGKRVKEAEKSGMIDYKALHHAFRVAFELKQILKEGDLIFPLPETKFLKQVKYKELDYYKDNLNEKLGNILDEIENLCQISSLPEKPDRKWADEFILACYSNQIK